MYQSILILTYCIYINCKRIIYPGLKFIGNICLHGCINSIILIFGKVDKTVILYISSGDISSQKLCYKYYIQTYGLFLKLGQVILNE